MSYKKIFILFCLAGMFLSGCSKKDPLSREEQTLSTEQTPENLTLGDLSNLDCSVIESEIPLPDQLYKMESRGEGEWNDDKIYKEFPKLIAAYGGPKEDELDAGKEIMIETWETNEGIFIPLEERRGEKIWNIKYCSDTLYLDMDSIRQLNTFQPDVIERITGETWNRQSTWLINEHAEPIATYKIGKDDTAGISYQLDGQEVSLEEAIAFAEKTMTENKELPLISTPGFEYRAESVQVYQFEENYAYFFIMSLYYRGVKLSSDPAGYTNIEGRIYVETLDKCTMFQKDKLNGIYTFDWLNETQDSVEELRPVVNYETALQILSGYLSNEHVFKILNAQLVYNFYVEAESNEEDGVNHITPNWMFEISTEQMQQYSCLYILIDVVSGEVVEVYA